MPMNLIRNMCSDIPFLKSLLLLLLTRWVFHGENTVWTLQPKYAARISVRNSSYYIEAETNGRHFADDIFKHIFFNENVWISIKISLKFVPKGPINNIPALVQIMAWRRPGDKPLSEPMMVTLPMHICVARPQWVKLISRENWFVYTIYFSCQLVLKICAVILSCSVQNFITNLRLSNKISANEISRDLSWRCVSDMYISHNTIAHRTPTDARLLKHMMTSSDGKLFRITGYLCGKFTGEFPAQKPVTWSFYVFFDMRLNKRLSKQSRC